MELKNKNVLVVGLGRTGVAAASFLIKRGARVTVADTASEQELGEFARQAHKMRVRLELGAHRSETFCGSELIVVSPGVSHNIEPIAQAKEKGVRVVGEIEMAFQFITEPIIAITGTNGKTTTTHLLGDMLKQSGLRVFVGGNIGRPLIGYPDQKQKAEIVVAEVSSFQLDTIDTFRPRIAILLNIADDHLDRYTDFEAYVRSKFRVFENQQSQDTAILNGSDRYIRANAGKIASRKLFVTGRQKGEAGADVSDESICLNLTSDRLAPNSDSCNGTSVDTRISLSRSDLRIPGNHNAENAAAAGLAALAAGGTIEGVQAAVKNFQGLAHRLEHIATIDDVRYFNDSKATNIDAVTRALACFKEPVILIMGGRNKGGNFHRLTESVKRHVSEIIALGEARQDIVSILGGVVPVKTAATMEEAVIEASRRSAPGNSVLLSPACSSFDMYRDYAHRGAVFTAAVKTLRKNQDD